MNNGEADFRARYERLKLLHEVSSVIHSSLDPQQALQLILGEAVRLMRATSGSVVLINPTNGILEIEASYGLPADASALKLRVGHGITGWVAQFGKPARVGDVTADARYVQVRQNIRSELAVPLEVNGALRGVLNVDADRNDAFSADDEQLLQDLAVQAARVIHNTWLYEQLRLKARLFEGLATVGQTINSALGVDEALKDITREGCRLMDAKMCSLLMLDESREWLELRASFGVGLQYDAKPRLSVDESFAGVVVKRRKALQLENIQLSAHYQNVEAARREGLVSLLSVPLIFDSQAIGVLSVYTARLHKFSNEEIRILSALADLSAITIEKARLYERIVQMEDQLRQSEKLSAIGLLAAEVAHEIRNPLTVMKMLFHSLNLQFSETDPRSRDTAIIGEKMEHLNRIVEQVLDFARTNEPRMEPVQVNKLVDDLALLVRHKLASQGVKFERKLEPALPAVQADATQLEQVFLNLILNAVEAMPDGGRLTITTRFQPPGGSTQEPGGVTIDFTDSGQGMTEEQQLRLFSSLLSTSKTRGTGLGLAIVRKVIEAHRGEIRVKSSPGKGTTFTVLLPI
ncbi:MAG: GAF domain-containing protein [Pedosphaera sp.]|nr:GAF domain-containing protein [Pedosphaera sp.]